MDFAHGIRMVTPKQATRTAQKSPAKKSAAKRSPAKKSPAKKSPAKRSPAKKSAAKKAPAKRGGAPLAEYNRKRNFGKTREPAGTVPKRKTKALHFVIQKHEASHLHFDFRLELDGVMKSWAVPKGPSLDPSVKRLAMEVEDHPISYNTFEGTIPQGEYGGGTVMLWDKGTYEALDDGGVEALRDGYARGNLKFFLHGERLVGEWVLARMRRPGRPQWLLIKHDDENATSTVDVTSVVTTSVTTGRTMEEIAGGGRVWQSNRG